MKPEPSTRKMWSPFFSAPAAATGLLVLAGAGLADAGLAAGFAAEDLDADDLDLLDVGMARMWAVAGPESMQAGPAVNHSAGCMAGVRAGRSFAQAGRS